MKALTLNDLNFAGKRVLLRLDLNVPMENGAVSDRTRITRQLPTIQALTTKGARVIILSHFGRPKGIDLSQSLAPVAKALEQELGQSVAFCPHSTGAEAQKAISALQNGDVLMLENTRFHAGEEKNDPALAQAFAELGDIYVNDAFSCAHRAHASTEGLAHVLPAAAGLNMQAELEALSKALQNPQRPVGAIVGGAKISSKLELLGNLIKKVDVLMIGGGMANTFLAAQGIEVGASLCEKDLLVTAQKIMSEAKNAGCTIILPVDAAVSETFAPSDQRIIKPINQIAAKDMILDMGDQSIQAINAALDNLKTLVWNGPFGAFEMSPYDVGTTAVAQYAASLTKQGKLLTVAGGGDTVSALNHAEASANFSYISTAGGAFLEWLEGKTLPGVLALENATQQQKTGERA